MYRLLILIGLLILLVFLVRAALQEFRRKVPPKITSKDHMIQDPVCRIYVPRKTAVEATIGGQTYYFCSTDCAQTFRRQLSS